MEIISVFNRKGGVGKTTITDTVASILATRGFKVLKIDNDPQGSLSFRSFDTELNNIKHRAEELNRGSVHDIFNPEFEIKNSIYKTDIKNLDIIPSTNKHLVTEDQINQRIRNTMYSLTKIKDEMLVLNRLKLLKYDFILIDCSPSMSIVNACSLNASDKLIIPILPSISSLEGLREVEALVEDTKNYNPKIEVLGLVLNMKENTKNDKELLESLKVMEYPILGTIRKTVKIKESEKENKTINRYSKNSEVCKDFEDLVNNVIEKINK